MKKPNSQAKTHSNQVGPLHTPSRTHKKTHSKAPGPLHTPSMKPVVCCNFATLIFFLFLNRLQAQAHSGPGSLLRGPRKDLFFLFIFRLQAQAQAHGSEATHYFIDSP